MFDARPGSLGSVSAGRARPHRRARRLMPTSLPAEARPLNIRNNSTCPWRGRPRWCIPVGPRLSDTRPVRNSRTDGRRRLRKRYPIRYPPSEVSLFMAEIRGYADDVLSPIYPLDSFPTANRGLAVGGCHWGGENWADLGDGRLGGLQRQPDTAICQYAPSTPRRP